MAKKMVCNFELETPVGNLENINKGLDFIAASLPDYPHTIDGAALGNILDALSQNMKTALKEINKISGLVVEGPQIKA